MEKAVVPVFSNVPSISDISSNGLDLITPVSPNYFHYYLGASSSGIYTFFYRDNSAYYLVAVGKNVNDATAYFHSSGTQTVETHDIVASISVDGISYRYTDGLLRISDPYVSKVPFYASIEEGIRDTFANITSPITYRLTNCSAPSAPSEAVAGDIVNVQLTFPQGYGIVTPSTDIYVTNNGVAIPSSYSNGQLSFTMPEE